MRGPYQNFYGIYESNGIGKEYNGYDDKLIFEGEYLMEKEMEKEKNIIKAI